jgi:hypothetical protein
MAGFDTIGERFERAVHRFCGQHEPDAQQQDDPTVADTSKTPASATTARPATNIRPML